MSALLPSFGNDLRAVVIGAGGGIGGALADRLEASGQAAEVIRLARPALDLADAGSIRAAAAAIEGPLDLIIVATGILSEAGRGPERSLKELDADWLARSFAVNAIGPALAAQAFLPKLARGRKAAFAALSARVGSIGDNRLGGWYGYRASKAALNQLLHTAAIELARTNPHALCVALHPGTVDTRLSAPFQKGVQPDKLFAPTFAADALLGVLDRLTPADSGGFFAWDGKPIAW